MPDATDIPSVCDPKGDASWYVSNGLAISPCVPANGDKCNVIVVAASNNVKYFIAPAVGIKTGSTGSIVSAACNGPCGGPPTVTIGFGLDGSNDANCPDTSGSFLNKKATYLLASMATQPADDNLCVAAENTDGDHFFCQPKSSDLTSVFQAVAGQLAAGAHLIALPQ